jgi:hypothetical protein
MAKPNITTIQLVNVNQDTCFTFHDKTNPYEHLDAALARKTHLDLMVVAAE